jgi:hypothetical protein
MTRRTSTFLAVGLGFAASVVAQQSLPSSFLTCIATQSTQTVNCPLTAGLYAVTQTLEVASNVNIYGVVDSPSAVVLQREFSPTLGAMIAAETGSTGVALQWITIDGNRYANGYNCLNPNSAVIDVDFSSMAGNGVVQYVDFIRSAGTALYIGGSSTTVSYSYFGYGYSGNGLSVSAQQSAARSTNIAIGNSYAIAVNGEPSTWADNSGAWFNTVQYAGTAGVAVQYSQNSYVVGNYLFQNRYEMADGVIGGQLFVADQTTSNLVADNTVDGNEWTTGSGTTVNDCSVGAGLAPTGIEGSGPYTQYDNNWVANNYAWGMLLRPWSATEPLNTITISSVDPYDAYEEYIIDTNGFCTNCYFTNLAGISVNTSDANGDGYSGTVESLTLDSLYVEANNYGIVLDDVSSGQILSNNGAWCVYSNNPNWDVTGSSWFTQPTNNCP